VYYGNQPSAGATLASDRLGSVQTGSRTTYYPYGEERDATNNDTQKFATYTRDRATGLDYANARYYSSQIARFTTADPYGGSARGRRPQSWNRYAYVLNDPINHTDPSGLEEVDWFEFIINLLGAGGGDGGPGYEVASMDSEGGWVFHGQGTAEGGYDGGYGPGTDPTSPEPFSFAQVFSPVAPEGVPRLGTGAARRLAAESDVWEALRHPECVNAVFGTAPNLGSGLFGTGPTPTVQDVFASITSNGTYGNIVFGTPANPDANSQTQPALWSATLILSSGQLVFTYNTITINNSTNPALAGSNAWNFASTAQNAITLLHELGHVLSNMGWTGGYFNNDDDNRIINGVNDQWIQLRCAVYF
jgi:RHS repeat-associated protein